MKPRTFWIALAAIGFALSSVMATASNYYVDPVNGSNSNGGASWADAWKTLTYATSQTNGTGTEANPTVIHLAEGTYSPSSNGETFPINFGAYNDYCSLIGAGSELTILRANGSELVVNSNAKACQVTVTDLMITGGKGGIYHRFGEPGEPHGYLTLERCVISGNTDGCAVEIANNGTVTIRRCIISDNSSDYRCPGLCLTPLDALNLTIENCDITNNTLVSPGTDGGGAKIVAWSGRISGCRFTGNSAPRKGGGLLNGWGQGIVKNCVFSGNSSGEGGGIYAGGIDRTTFQNCLITNNTCTVDGGGIFVEVAPGFPPSIVQIVNCTIADNQGCGVRVEDPVNEWYSEAHLYNCTVWGQEDSVVNVPCSMISHCDLSDGSCNGQNGNISQDPFFVTGAQGDYYLSHAGVNSK